jgi:hypothetical protein
MLSLVSRASRSLLSRSSRVESCSSWWRSPCSWWRASSSFVASPTSSRPRLAAQELALSLRACTKASLSSASSSLCCALERRLSALALAWSRRCYAARLTSSLARAGLGAPTVMGILWHVAAVISMASACA